MVSDSVVEAGFELIIFLPQPLMYWDNRYVPAHLVRFVIVDLFFAMSVNYKKLNYTIWELYCLVCFCTCMWWSEDNLQEGVVLSVWVFEFELGSSGFVVGTSTYWAISLWKSEDKLKELGLFLLHRFQGLGSDCQAFGQTSFTLLTQIYRIFQKACYLYSADYYNIGYGF